jgi:membrane fusion protein (multidrug efflux system)
VNGMRLIAKGVAEGDRVVVDGVQKISDGAVVDAQPAPEATASAAPATTPPAAAGGGSNPNAASAPPAAKN